jgi:hypothetical protein
MPRPTKTALKKHPQAVIMLGFHEKHPDVVGDYDYEWFDSVEGVEAYLTDPEDNVLKWAEEDVTAHGNLFHIIVAVSDTSTEPMTLKTVYAFAKDGLKDKATEWQQKIVANPDLCVFKQAAPAAKGAAAPTKAAKPSKKQAAVQRGRKPTTAAKAVQGAPAAKGEAVRKAAHKPPTKQDPGTAPKPKANRAALKARLAKKQAEGNPDAINKAIEDVNNGADPTKVAKKLAGKSRAAKNAEKQQKAS